MDAQQARQRVHVMFSNVRERMQPPPADLPWHVRIGRFLAHAVVIGFLLLLLAFLLVLGLVAAVIGSVFILTRRAWRALVGGFHVGRHAEEGRRNVRVIDRS